MKGMSLFDGSGGFPLAMQMNGIEPVYQPANFHMIGMTHRYAYCAFANKRCLEVRKSECSLRKVSE